ncbi:MAG TPA: hypothetical protein DEZ08_06580 [Dehalococcoidia bacterium]|nr:hypothetical protein [Dehalococcoidia bacterium]
MSTVNQNKSALPWEQTMLSFFKHSMDINPNKNFVEFLNRTLTYKEFYNNLLKSAEQFISLGVKPGDRVCMLLDNCPEYLLAWFGLSAIGAIAVPINTAYKSTEISFIVNNCSADTIIFNDRFSEIIKSTSLNIPSVKSYLVVPEPQYSGSNIEPSWSFFNPESREIMGLSLPDNIESIAISTLVYTSGTTGEPKGVKISQQMYVAAGQGFQYWTNGTKKDRFFTCLPFFHANAQYYSTMGAIASAGTLVVVDRFSASRFWSQVRQSKATVVNFIGMMMSILAKSEQSPTDSNNSVRLFYGSPAFSPDFLDSFQKRFGTEIIVGFGMTETCYGTIEVLGEPRRANSSGKSRKHPDPRFINQIKIADESGTEVPFRTAGEILIKNPVLMEGYWNNQTQTDLALQNGWLHTGDLASMDENGFIYFVDRKKDIIRRRGENISSKEVEDIVKKHHAVLECAIIAVPSELGEDEIKAYIILKEGFVAEPRELIYWWADHIAYFKVPRYIEFRDELPQTPSLRIRKDVLRRETPDLITGCFDREDHDIQLR